MWTSRHRTWDEYIDIPFLITRLLVTGFGGLLVAGMVVGTWVWLASLWPTPPPPSDEVRRTDCTVVVKANPLGIVLFLALAALPIFGAALVWRRPRAGFLMAGGGLAMIVVSWRVLALLAGGIDAARGTFGWPQDTVVTLLLLWLTFASWKVGPAGPNEPFRGPLALESAPSKC